MRKIHLSVYDVAQLFGRYDKKERYSILIVFGEHQFVFSNKQKAERFLKRYQRFLSESFQFYSMQIPKLLEFYFAMLPVIHQFDSRIITEKFEFALKIIDKVFTTFEMYDSTIIIHWSIMLSDELLKLCKMLIRVGKRARHYQSDLMKIRQLKFVIESYQNSFFDNYKNSEFKCHQDSFDGKIIHMYDPLKLALNH